MRGIEKQVHPIEILLVEDNPGDVRLTLEALRECKMRNTLRVTRDGVEALAFLHQEDGYANAPRPDLILLDLNLPKKDGREVLAEIKATKSRLYKTVCLGLVAIPVLTFLAEQPGIRFVGPIIPFVVLLLTILFVAEEHALMRCGRYIRLQIEPTFESGWEQWLESQPKLRIMDKYLFGCFLIVFFVFYFSSVGIAIEKLWTTDDGGLSTGIKAAAGGVVYGIGAIWMIVTLVHHWRSCIATSE